ncbi:hypothetical protein K1T71_007024 [Dendrolimus kikuchii]|uniref:Uncharacterized protein n=1 Tax=Dendrolimus kikuchii TaxID=765133 RepID=A0ACC1CZH0_9NEOP|nr:hypothetical protein K1T71_007024 [Dendrolimus kikuchii]
MSWKRPSSPSMKKFRVAPTAGKVMASVFWDIEGILFIDYMSKGQTITGPYYANLIPTVHLAPSDFHLFPKLKEKIRGTKFQDNDAIMAAVEEPVITMFHTNKILILSF